VVNTYKAVKRDNFMKIKLTNEIILADILSFETRIQSAKDKLAVLPPGPSSWKERKKHRAIKRELENEINHVYGLISIAESALLETVSFRVSKGF